MRNVEKDTSRNKVGRSLDTFTNSSLNPQTFLSLHLLFPYLFHFLSLSLSLSLAHPHSFLIPLLPIFIRLELPELSFLIPQSSNHRHFHSFIDSIHVSLFIFLSLSHSFQSSFINARTEFRFLFRHFISHLSLSLYHSRNSISV